MGRAEPIATRLFTVADQEKFAQLSGDRNPMHMNEVAARRTQAGSPVVHGVNALLWSLDYLVPRLPDYAKVLSLRVEFKKWIHVGKTVNSILSEISENRAKVRLEVDGLSVAAISVCFDLAPMTDLCVSMSSWEPVTMPETALEPDIAKLSECAGIVGFASVSDQIVSVWPNLARTIGPSAVAALVATSTLVGMNCPGLHSMYKELTVAFCSTPFSGSTPGLVYKVETYDERFRLARIHIEGRTVDQLLFTGTVRAVASLPPVKQPSIPDISELISPNEFSRTCSLVVGGSRGLGELTAKVLVAGGGKVIITYAVGKAEADRVQREILDAGGECEVMHYDVRSPAAEQLGGLGGRVTHLYYYATPTIFQSKGRLFAEDRFSLFVDFYLKSFFDLCNSVRREAEGNIRIFYPSSVFVNERPQDMTEYAMAKSAGEVLCADINRFFGGVQVLIKRLPRMETDQTASVIPVKKADSVSILLPVIREMCAEDISV